MNKLLEPSFPTKSEFWGIRCEAGKRYSQVVKKPFHLTMAALDPEVRGKSTFVSLMVERGDRQYLLCNLKQDSIVQVNLNLFFDVGERVTFSLKGEATVHLSGYHILSSGMSKENSKAVAKVPATLNDIDLDDNSDDDDVDFEEIIAGEDLESEDEEDSDEEDDDDDEEDDEEEEDEDSDEEEKKDLVSKAQVMKNTPKKRQLEEDSDEDDSSEEDSSDDVVEIVPNLKKTLSKSKKAKLSNASPPAQNNKGKNTPNKKMFDNDFDFDDGPAKGKKNPFIDDLNSSIGRTPMPKKSASVSFKETPGNKNLKKETPLKKEKQDGQSNQSPEATNVQTTPLSTESKKKKKKKRKNKGEVDASGSPKLNDNAAGKTPKKLPGGVEFEDLRVGHGLEAKKGKLVHMYYTGKLDSGRVFDSTQPGSKPFSFKLGSGEVIKGLELATQGMKVGGKRKIRIPPEMGYKNQRMGDIPPSSTLNFVVELKAVS